MFRFPWGDMHSLNLGWFLQKFNELREDWATAEAGIDGALDAEIQRAEDALSDVFDARDAAAASATAAAGSATAAGTSATAAQNSATAAGNSATLANNKATAAGLSEAAAAQSATQAGNSATQAGNSATAAAESATQAGQSAANAVTSATTAGTNATAAAASATNAATSAINAEASAARAEQVKESIPEDYTSLSDDVDELKSSYLEMPCSFLTKKLFGSGSFSYTKWSRTVTRTGNYFKTTTRNNVPEDVTRYSTNLFGETIRTVSGTTITPDINEFIPITELGIKITIVLYRDYPTIGNSDDGIRIALADANDNILYNEAYVSSSQGTLLVIDFNALYDNYPTATKAAIYYYSGDASTHETYLGIYPRL